MSIILLDAVTLGMDMDLSLFRDLDDCHIWLTTEDDELVSRIRDSRVIVTNRVHLTKEVLKEADKLELIALTATGFNNVDIEYCRQRGISVANVSSYSTESVTQHCFSMLFYLLEQTRYYDDYVREGRYREDKQFVDVSRPWFELHGKTWGIIGMGAIGRRVAEVAAAFGAHPLYYSTSGHKRPESFPRCSLQELLNKSDIVSVHAPLNEKTQNLMGESEFRNMKKGAFFLNLGRGAIIDEAALALALSSDWIAGAGLDVLTQEPPLDNNPLLKLLGKKLLITPHHAWGSIESRKRLIHEVYENVQAHLRGEKRNLIV
ncbi:D-2-hydroxyacid dehydrogenase [Oceanispirochaeta sp.]|jgi:lactate dehydrogenase-like 2-hydroxyacid dehydrogenase|uniref:D-2-hydroxyacid dehydrogenase n=1 Tax=Oceanispirochaeta sp. TaxID=2035350 RepID=UPI00261DAB5F|nr:D-2-hydroxyacid dehydrogenase [Oceanispirochaeta sp.]MDA3957792.1 D-2-hydroxyacid dehydrogenase [Oceanispirochaeta sp.]